MSDQSKLGETLQAVLNDAREIADLILVLFNNTEKDGDEVREMIQKLHVFSYTYGSLNNDKLTIKNFTDKTMLPCPIKKRLKELGITE